MKSNIVTIIVVVIIATIIQGAITDLEISRAINNQNKTLAAIKAAHPETVKLSQDEEAKFDAYEKLVEKALGKAWTEDKDGKDFSLEDQKELMNHLTYWGTKIVPVEGSPLQLYVRGSIGKSLPGIYLKIGSEERYIIPDKLITYTGYDIFKEQREREEALSMGLGGG